MKNLIIKQGDTLRRELKLKYQKTGAVVDLTGCTAYSHFRTFPGQELLLEATTSINSETGTVTVIFSAEQMGGIEPGEYGYDVRLEKDGDIRTIFTERVSVVLPYTELGGE